MILISLLCWAVWIASPVGARGPDFIIMGVQKAGTTSMRAHLRNHTGIYMPVSEVHWFDNNDKCNTTQYELQLSQPDRRHKRDELDNSKIGDCTPVYSYIPGVVYQIKKCYPDVKLIMLLRDPIARAFSAYVMSHKDRKKYVNNMTFLEVVHKDTISYGRMQPHGWLEGEFVRRGVYVEQLERMSSLFNRSQIHVICSEQLLISNDYNATLRFIGVEPRILYNHRGTKRMGSYGDMIMESEAKSRLHSFYEPYNNLLKMWIQGGEDTYYFDKKALLKCVDDWNQKKP
jgi:hypothetical protein